MNPRNVDAIAEELFGELKGDDHSLYQARLKLEEVKLWAAKYVADRSATKSLAKAVGTARSAMQII